MSGFWKQIERIGLQSFPFNLDDTDICYYAREYIPGAGYAASEANDLVQNLKKPMDRVDKPEWRHKDNAIRRFAADLSKLDFTGTILTFVPSSKCKTDPMYDNRMEKAFGYLRQHQHGIVTEQPFELQTTVTAAHLGGSRDMDSFYGHLNWIGFQSNPVDKVVLVDDVVTTGSKFKACKRMILEHHPGIAVYGVFWARTVWL
jgi:hypothetical protein